MKIMATFYEKYSTEAAKETNYFVDCCFPNKRKDGCGFVYDI